MKYYSVTSIFMLSGFLIFFGAAEYLGISILEEPSPLIVDGGILQGLIGISFLVIDVVLPVPASLVMIAHGAVFGLWLGAMISMVGSLGAGLLAFFIGRRSARLLDRYIPADEREQGAAFLEKWGAVGVIITRPIPMLAETVAILAGTSSITWQQMTLATVVGSLPAALLYAAVGSLAVSMNSTMLSLACVFVIATIFWVSARKVSDQRHFSNVDNRSEAMNQLN